MRHLFSSRVEIYESTYEIVDGARVAAWGKVNAVFDTVLGEPGEMLCRLDLGYVRVGKDQPAPVTAGKAPDRTGLMLCSVTDQLKAGHVIKPVSGPISGVFQIKTIPDVAPDFGGAHHMEVQVFEINQSASKFPADTLET